MNFLADECTYLTTVELLRSKAHNVIMIPEIGLWQANDSIVIEEAQKRNRILITRDKDFANILNYPPQNYLGIIVLRQNAENEERVHQLLWDFLDGKDEDNLRSKLVVISEDKVRIR